MIKINLFKKIQNFPQDLHLSNMVKKKFLSISVLVSEIVTFMSKKNFLYELFRKCFKTTERHSLAVFGSHCWEKKFLLIIIPFYWFYQKQFKQIQIFLRICRIKHGKKFFFFSFSVLIFEIVSFMSKMKVLDEFPPKNFKTRERHSLAHFMEKNSFC